MRGITIKRERLSPYSSGDQTRAIKMRESSISRERRQVDTIIYLRNNTLLTQTFKQLTKDVTSRINRKVCVQYCFIL